MFGSVAGERSWSSPMKLTSFSLLGTRGGVHPPPVNPSRTLAAVRSRGDKAAGAVGNARGGAHGLCGCTPEDRAKIREAAQRFTVESQLFDRLLHYKLLPQQAEAQHKNVVQVLWLVVQV